MLQRCIGQRNQAVQLGHAPGGTLKAGDLPMQGLADLDKQLILQLDGFFLGAQDRLLQLLELLGNEDVYKRQLLNRKFIKDINEFYGEYQAGADTESRGPLTDYTTDDVEPSVVMHREGGK